MEIKGEYKLAATRTRVWEALNDPAVLKLCIPGCQSLEQESDKELIATVVTKIGPVKATFNGRVVLENINPPQGYSIVGEGKGGIAGFAKGRADVQLADDGEGTLLTYQVDAQVGGKIAQLGGRLIDSTTRKLTDQFFGSFSQVICQHDRAP